jgi:hypothetical protein
MLVQVTDHDGNNVAIDPQRIIKIRQSGVADEPKNAVFIDYATGGVFAKATVADIVKLFGAYIRLAALHAPDGTPIFLNIKGIAGVTVDHAYAGNCVAVVTEDFQNPHVSARNKIALNETVADNRSSMRLRRRSNVQPIRR